MIGVVLCGGQSSRMGSDKGLLPIGATIWAQHAVQKLASLQMPVVLSVNSQHIDAYRKQFPDKMLVVDREAMPAGGPLKGLLSVHSVFPKEDLLVLAVDLPMMPVEVLQELAEENKRYNSFAYVFENGAQLEPLCALYRAEGLDMIHAKLQEGLLKRFSMHHILELLQARRLPLPVEWQNGFLNCNTPEDLMGLQL